MIADKQTRDLIAALLASAADEECADHFGGITQEPALTARIGKALEDKLRNVDLRGWNVRVLTQDLPDRGAGALERKIGADIYFGIEVMSDGRRETKGFLAQAKWRDDRGGQTRLTEQCSDMLKRTDSAYVWFYGPDGITYLNARTVETRDDRVVFRGKRLQHHFARILECVEGDRSIGLPSGPNQRTALGEMLENLGATTGIAVSITEGTVR